MTDCTWDLTKAQQRIVTALLQQRQQILNEANTAIAEINAGLDETLEMLARKRGLDPEDVEFANGPDGGIVLRKKPEPPPESDEKARGEEAGDDG